MTQFLIWLRKLWAKLFCKDYDRTVCLEKVRTSGNFLDLYVNKKKMYCVGHKYKGCPLRGDK